MILTSPGVGREETEGGSPLPSTIQADLNSNLTQHTGGDLASTNKPTTSMSSAPFALGIFIIQGLVDSQLLLYHSLPLTYPEVNQGYNPTPHFSPTITYKEYTSKMLSRAVLSFPLWLFHFAPLCCTTNFQEIGAFSSGCPLLVGARISELPGAELCIRVNAGPKNQLQTILRLLETLILPSTTRYYRMLEES
jgi:hypothetical protein